MDVDKIKDFFIFHVEKMILFFVVAAAVFMVYSGLNKEDITKSHEPKQLIDSANQVKSEVDNERTAAIIEGREPLFDIEREILVRTKPVNGSAYAVATWAPIDFSDFSGVKRRDPKILAPRFVRATGVLSPVVYRDREEDQYALALLEPAGPLEIEEQEKPKPKKPERSPRGRRGAMDMFSEGMEPSMDEEMDEESAMMDMGEMGEMGGPGMVGQVRKLPDDSYFGLKPKTLKSQKGADDFPVPRKGHFIAGSAVVPYKELYENYKNAFLDAEEFNPMRDRPVFLGYNLQRADVTTKAVVDLAESDWVDRYDSSVFPIIAGKIWCGVAPELISKEYREDVTLTMWIPPVVNNDYSKWCLHPKIPMKTAAQLAREQAAEEKLREQEQEAKQTEDILRNFKLKEGASGGAADMSYDTMEGGGEEMMDGMDMGMGFNTGMMMDSNPVEYKLIRFYDFASLLRSDKSPPKEGRKYVYRVRFYVDDPNFPQDFQQQPSPRALDDEAYDRIMALVKKAEKAKERSFKLYSEWSEPSEPVSLPRSNQFFAGGVKPANKRTIDLGSTKIEYELESPKCEMVVTGFQDAYSTYLDMLARDLTEGSVLTVKSPERKGEGDDGNETKEFYADIVDPVTREIKKLPDAELVTGATVVDIDGGDKLTISDGLIEGDETELPAPGAMLIFDPSGGLRVHTETGDQEFFRIKSFADERGR